MEKKRRCIHRSNLNAYCNCYIGIATLFDGNCEVLPLSGGDKDEAFKFASIPSEELKIIFRSCSLIVSGAELCT